MARQPDKTGKNVAKSRAKPATTAKARAKPKPQAKTPEVEVKTPQAKVEADVDLPTGYSLTWGGQFENLKRAEQRLGLVIPVVFILIGILLFVLGRVFDLFG